MAAQFSLVGSLGAVSVGSNGGAVTPAYGQTPTAGNLLVCWVTGFGVQTSPTTPSGWTLAKQGTAGGCASSLFYLPAAAGGDAAPTIASVSSQTWVVMLGEFAPTAGKAIVDQVWNHGVSSPTTPHVATAGAVDTTVGELMVTCFAIDYSVGATKTITDTYNNVASPTIVNNNATSTTNHYSFGYGTTTANASANSDSIAVTTTNEGGAELVAVSFRTTSATQTSHATIKASATTTQTAKGHVQTAPTATQTAKGRVSKAFTVTQSAEGRVSANPTATRTAHARIAAPLTTTQIAHGRLQNTPATTQTAQGRVQTNPTAPQVAHAHVLSNLTKTQTARASITRIIQTVPVTETAPSTTLPTPTVTTQTGSGLLLAISIDHGATTTVTGIADTASNTWAQILRIPAGGAGVNSLEWWSCASATGLSAGTITITLSTSDIAAARFWEIADGAVVDVDASAGSTNAGTAWASGTTPTLANNNEMAFGAVSLATPTSGVTVNGGAFVHQGAEFVAWPAAGTVDLSTDSGANSVALHSGELLISTTAAQSYGGNISGAESWAAAIIILANDVNARTTTQTAKARISKARTRTQTGTARIITSVPTATQTGSAGRVQILPTVTQAASARITNTPTKTQVAHARVSGPVTTTQTTVGRISVTPTVAQSALGRVSTTPTRTQTAHARIAVFTTPTTTQAATARIAAPLTAAQTGTARISAPVTSTQAGTARVSTAVTGTQIGHARVQVTPTVTQTAQGRIATTLTTTQTARARIGGPPTKTQTAHARILRTTLTATQTAHARVALNRTTTQTAHSRVATQPTRTNTAHARIRVALLQTAQVGHARIATPQTATQTGMARIVPTIPVFKAPLEGISLTSGRRYGQPPET